MFVIVKTEDYDGPEAIGLYESESEAFDNLFAWWVECGIANDLAHAQEVYDSTPHTWVVGISDPYKIAEAA